MTMHSKFPGTCKACGQTFAVGELIQWERSTGARHATPLACIEATARAAEQPKAPVVEMNQKPIAAFLTAARDRGLKFPKARFLAPGGGELRLSVAGDTSRIPGAIQVKLNDEWVGRITPDGIVQGPRLTSQPALLDALSTIATDPAAAAKAYGAMMCRCSFCDKALTDDGSVEVGYGPVCAKHWGLPHTPKGTRVLQPAA